MNTLYHIFSAQIKAAVATFPTLHSSAFADHEILTGTLSVVDQQGKHWEDYEVEIHPTLNFPYCFPILFETSGKIPKIGDWHINEDDHSCCLMITPEEILSCKNGITLEVYIREYVMPYLFNQTHRRVEGYYVNGEYSHGINGLFEYYTEVLNSNTSVPYTIHLMKFIATQPRPKRTSECFCGSRKKFRHCHRAAYEKLSPLGTGTLLLHANNIAARYYPPTQLH